MLTAGMLFACDNSAIGGGAAIDVEIWSTYNTYKVMQDDHDAVSLGEKIEVSLCKGETEGGQIILTPNGNVGNYNVGLSQLKTASGALFPMDNVKVYVQKYIEIKTKSKGQTNYEYGVGFIPDMLLPIEKAIEYNETKIQSGKNQGITVEFTASGETEAGNYTGTATVTVETEKYYVPVNVTVWDIDVSKCYGMTSVRSWNEQFYEGELDNTPQLYKNYYETMLNSYKFCYEDLPGSSDPQLMADSAIKYWDNPNFTSFNIPTYERYNNLLDKSLLMPYLKSLAQKSIPGRILFDKAYIYPNFLDEPTADMYDEVEYAINSIYELKEELLSELKGTGYFDGYDPEYEVAFTLSLTNVPIIITASTADVKLSMKEKINSYCVIIDQLNSEASRELHYEMKEKNSDVGGDLWYYTCTQPLYPNPSHHLDDYLIGARIMRWMENYYGLDGYLYWSVNCYTRYSGGQKLYADPYKTALRFGDGEQGVMGDGFMVYPKAYYNTENPLGSLRLTTFRDGQEDLNLLHELENAYRNQESRYGLEYGIVDVNEAMKEIYSSLFSGTAYNRDDAAFYAAREKIVEDIYRLKGEAGLLVNRTIDKNNLQADIYVNQGYEIKVNGQMLTAIADSGEGKKFTFTSRLDAAVELNVEVVKDGATVVNYNCGTSPKTSVIDISADKVTCTQGSQISVEGGKLNAVLATGGESINDKLAFRPGLYLGKDMFGAAFDAIGDIAFTVTNTGSTSVTLRIKLTKGKRGITIKENILLNGGESAVIRLKDLYKLSDVSLGEFTDIEITMENVDETNELLPYGYISISELICSYK